MAVMGRKKQMVKQMIEFNKGKNKEINKEQQEKNIRSRSKQEISEEEHNKRVELLKGLGFLKEDKEK